MLTKRDLKTEVESVQALKTLAFAFEQISAMRMQAVRKSVIQTRDFLEKLAEVYTDVKKSWQRQVQLLALKKKMLEPFQNLGQAVILLSSNASLYGDINQKVFRLFIDYIRQNSSSKVVVIGKFGKNLIEQEGSIKDYSYFDLPETKPTFENLKPILEEIPKYKRVLVFYGKFANVLTQIPAVVDLGGEQKIESKAITPILEIDFRFEPDLEKLMEFFESQVAANIFQQTVQEAELARHGSRIKSMEDALGNIEKIEDLMGKLSRKVNASINNKKIQQTISGINLWKR